jgi:hypothetical protein
MKNLVSIEQKIEKLICRLGCGETIVLTLNKGNNKITELRTILQRESQNS